MLGQWLWPRSGALEAGKRKLSACDEAKVEAQTIRLLAEGARPSFVIELRQGLAVSGLSACILMGAFGAARALLAAGADPNAAPKGRISPMLTPLYFALRGGDAEGAKIAEALMDAGADPFKQACRDYSYDDFDGDVPWRSKPEPVFMWMLFHGRDDLAEKALSLNSDEGLRILVQSLPNVLSWCQGNKAMFSRVEALRLDSLGMAVDELSAEGDGAHLAMAAYDPQAQWARTESDLMLGQCAPSEAAPAAKKNRL